MCVRPRGPGSLICPLGRITHLPASCPRSHGQQQDTSVLGNVQIGANVSHHCSAGDPTTPRAEGPLPTLPQTGGLGRGQEAEGAATTPTCWGGTNTSTPESPENVSIPTNGSRTDGWIPPQFWEPQARVGEQRGCSRSTRTTALLAPLSAPAHSEQPLSATESPQTACPDFTGPRGPPPALLFFRRHSCLDPGGDKSRSFPDPSYCQPVRDPQRQGQSRTDKHPPSGDCYSDGRST